MERHDEPCGHQDRQEDLQLRILEESLEIAPFPALPVEQEITAGQEHGDGTDGFQGQAVIAGKIKESVTAAGRHGHEPLVDGHSQRQAGQPVQEHGKGRNGQVDASGLAGRFLHAGDHGTEGHALVNRQGQAETAADLGHDRNQHEDEIEAAEPFHEAVP